MSDRVSVCIPTCDRPEYFEIALQSVLSQSPTPYEVLVGDDSGNNETEQVVRNYSNEHRIKYLKNAPPLGQAGNVHRLFQEAEGDFLILLHDDDRLVDGALRTLLSGFENRPGVVATFGKQQVITPEGTVKWEATKGVNHGYYRTAEYTGKQSSSLRSAVVQQFPNDGYMVRVDAAKKVGYKQPGVGDACDFAFGVELARQTGRDFYYMDSFTSQYRRSEESIARGEEGGDAAYRALKLVLNNLPKEVTKDPAVQDWIRRKAPVAIMVAAEHGHAWDGLHWFFSRHHLHRVATLGGLRRLSYLLRSLMARRG
jgi:glycosyltransferase involved in cell wall biosynthesis